eukprot:CAMPEP_0114527514 /NCGR_PEP_ID=MMETSP0109-20121206/23661_1 /TAXON_ID=29199 /ORGANISM="Chlorarachnion reptans, Strain CCCM449" /LENGTH=119 /DNA_ID=CAMNT_0001709493 /DNA_START=1250 /DNA_END=1606 /DNA_ORIENTATION=-
MVHIRHANIPPEVPCPGVSHKRFPSVVPQSPGVSSARFGICGSTFGIELIFLMAWFSEAFRAPPVRMGMSARLWAGRTSKPMGMLWRPDIERSAPQRGATKANDASRNIARRTGANPGW